MLTPHDDHVLPENFSEQPAHIRSIKTEDKIYSATADGRIPWVSVEDIAETAFHALIDEESHNTEHILVGPELHSYDDVRAALMNTLIITHIDIAD